jgi:hypothetical protein
MVGRQSGIRFFVSLGVTQQKQQKLLRFKAGGDFILKLFKRRKSGVLPSRPSSSIFAHL